LVLVPEVKESTLSADLAAKARSGRTGALADVQRRLGKKGKLPKPKAHPKGSLTKSIPMARVLEDEIKKLVKAIKDYQTDLTALDRDCSTLDGFSIGDLAKLTPPRTREREVAPRDGPHPGHAPCGASPSIWHREPRLIAATLARLLIDGSPPTSWLPRCEHRWGRIAKARGTVATDPFR
jgi:hypothetical protein